MNIPRIMIAGTSSGSGKTTITIALLRALSKRNINITAFKCGPDYIDPLFHREVLGVPSYNLDSFFCQPDTLRYLMIKNAQDRLAVAEGVMGYYDGYAEDKGSSYEIAEILNIPVILTVNCAGMSDSVMAVIKGFCTWRRDSRIEGVILNNISASTYLRVKDSIEAKLGIKVYGYFPKLKPENSLKSRHLGLVTASEIDNFAALADSLARQAEQTLDIDGITALAKSAKHIPRPEYEIKQLGGQITVAVARDEAFCFYYEDNLDLLRRMGAKIVFFSPLRDDKLPVCDGMIFGGGYPELYADKLEQNTSLRADIKKALQENTPCIAECGGYMYLGESIEGKRMVGFLHDKFENKGVLTRFGYIEITALRDNVLCGRGGRIKAHEFHYYDTDKEGDAFEAHRISRDIRYRCVQAGASFYAGFPHMHFYANMDFAISFYKKCLEKI